MFSPAVVHFGDDGCVGLEPITAVVVSEEGDSKSPVAHPPRAAIAGDRASPASEPRSDTALQPGAILPTQAGMGGPWQSMLGLRGLWGLEILFLPSC